MTIDVYHGINVTAKNANDYIDIRTIEKGCSMMNDTADKITTLRKKITLAKELCDGETLTFNGQTMERKIEKFEEDTNNFAYYINELSETINLATIRAFNKKQLILNEEAKKKDSLLVKDFDGEII